MDTLAVQTEVDRPTWQRIAEKLRQSSVRAADGTESRKAYGAFILSRPTLYLSRSSFVPTCRVVLEFCPGKVMRGHNVYASELCARTALDFVCDEVEGRTGVRLHEYTFTVCRLDVAHTFIGLQAEPYLVEAARFSLVRRTRVVYEHGVGYKAKSRAELIYDKRAEVHSALAELPDAKLPDGDPRPLADLLASIPEAPTDGDGRVPEATGLAVAARLVANGALRVECRVKGSPNVARTLDLPDAHFATVVRDENAYRLLSSFLVQFDFSGASPTPPTIQRLRDAGHSGARLLQLLGFRELERLVGSDRAAYRALGLPVARRRALRRALHTSGAHRIGAAALRPLVVTRDDLAEIRKLDEGDMKTWQARRTDWRNYWQLRPDDHGLLAA